MTINVQKKLLLVAATALLFTLNMNAQTSSVASPDSGNTFLIRQVDSSRLMVNGLLSVYIDGGSFADSIDLDDIIISDEASGELEILDIRRGALQEDGINFLLMLDASGSMYDELYNTRARIDEARDAVAGFISLTEASNDSAALALFNTGFTVAADFESDSRQLMRNLQAYRRPERAMAYTELYNAIGEASRLFQSTGGRQVIILLSDGANNPYMTYESGENPYYGLRQDGPETALSQLMLAGVSLYAVNFSNEPDPQLADIALQSGGAVYEARSGAQLAEIYQNIRQDILGELRVTVRAPGIRSSNRQMKATSGDLQASYSYYLPLLFGEPGFDALPVWVLPLILASSALLVLIVLYLVPFQHRLKSPELHSMDNNATLVLNAETTVIGASRDADFTLSEAQGADAMHATVIRDGKGDYNIESKRNVYVNNKATNKRKLKSGDVIRIEGATIVFQTPEESTQTTPNSEQ